MEEKYYIKLTKESLNNSEKYIAISYVWKQNLMVTTQVQQIINKMRESKIAKMRNLSYLKCWLDVRSAKGQNNEIWQVKNMAKIYTNAEVVIAIIPELYNCRETNITNVLSASIWMSRAWCLQEQIVANKIIAVIDDKICDISKNVDWLLQKELFGFRTVHRQFGLTDNSLNFGINSDKALSNLKAQARKGQLNKLAAFALMSNRVMGEENKDYEPILGLIENEELTNDEYNLTFLYHTMEYVNKTNHCWMPKRLNVRKPDKWMCETKGRLECNGILVIDKACIIIANKKWYLLLEGIEERFIELEKLIKITTETNSYITHISNKKQRNLTPTFSMICKLTIAGYNIWSERESRIIDNAAVKIDNLIEQSTEQIDMILPYNMATMVKYHNINLKNIWESIMISIDHKMELQCIKEDVTEMLVERDDYSSTVGKAIQSDDLSSIAIACMLEVLVNLKTQQHYYIGDGNEVSEGPIFKMVCMIAEKNNIGEEVYADATSPKWMINFQCV